MKFLWLIFLAGLVFPTLAAPLKPPLQIRWDPATRVLIQQGGLYGRMTRLSDGRLICGYEQGGKCWVRASGDAGKTWDAAILAAELAGSGAANPEVLRLQNGTLLLFFNGRPHDKDLHFTISLVSSRDGGASWSAPQTLFTAGTTSQSGCWEPAAAQLPSGEIQVFFANNVSHEAASAQEISLCRSQDNGQTWSAPETVSFRPAHRDGMPVPLRLAGSQGLTIAIEDSGLNAGSRTLQPAIIHAPAVGALPLPVGSDSLRREAAILPPLPPQVYAGAPYLVQLPGGETLLSCQLGSDDRDPKMTVYIGSRQAENFAWPTLPFAAPGHGGGEHWNALFVKGPRTVTALSSTSFDGISGLWVIDGDVTR